MYILIFLLGMIIGSFLNICIYRIPKIESIVFPESHCIHCSTPLKCYNLTSVLKFLFLKGKCRFCEGKIIPQFPIVECLNGLIYLILFYYFELSLEFIYYSSIISILIMISVIDYYHQIIPDFLLFLIIIITVSYTLINYFIIRKSILLIDSIIGFFAAGFFFILIALISNGGMGGGDIKLISILGFILGLKKIVLNIVLSFIIGAIVSIFLLLSRKKSRKDPIPFGPFINISFIISILWGEPLIQFYINSICKYI
ncbi:MAG: prepilin peptidase [Clostridiales bacterium]|nr:prepilin peptidase [Clostridiales bacterium]